MAGQSPLVATAQQAFNNLPDFSSFSAQTGGFFSFDSGGSSFDDSCSFFSDSNMVADYQLTKSGG